MLMLCVSLCLCYGFFYVSNNRCLLYFTVWYKSLDIEITFWTWFSIFVNIVIVHSTHTHTHTHIMYMYITMTFNTGSGFESKVKYRLYNNNIYYTYLVNIKHLIWNTTQSHIQTYVQTDRERMHWMNTKCSERYVITYVILLCTQVHNIHTHTHVQWQAMAYEHTAG